MNNVGNTQYHLSFPKPIVALKKLFLLIQSSLMKLTTGILSLLLFCSFASFAQPRYSPEVRAEKEAQWMTDSLHITPEQSKKVHDISLTYNQQMDKASQLPSKQKDKAQQHLINKKDADLKTILNKEQYRKYCKWGKQIRKMGKIQYSGPNLPN